MFLKEHCGVTAEPQSQRGTQPHVQTNKVKRSHPQALQKSLRILCGIWDTNMKPQIANGLDASQPQRRKTDSEAMKG